jgi:methylenetetrahydrofolate reductase (NADPH)
MPDCTYSFEFFPPKTPAAEAQLWDALPKLAALKPKYMTVTYGAGGSTHDGTLSTLKRMRDEYGIPLASHLTFINTTKQNLYDVTDELWNENIRHIVALRGDMPQGLNWPLDSDGDYFQYTSDFVQGLRGQRDFEISVSAYPEKHPDSRSLQDDIDALRKKCDAGATRAITQFFFENEKYYDFVDQCRAAGIKTPIYPGLLPIHDFKSMMRFAQRCQASVPVWLQEKFERLEGKPEDAHNIAQQLLHEQVQDLARNGVPHIHFYTLNRAAITEETCKALRNKV